MAKPASQPESSTQALESFTVLRRKLLKSILLVMTVLGLPGVVLGSAEAMKLGQVDDIFLYVFLYLAIAVTALLFQRLPFLFCAGVMLGSLYVLSVFNLLYFSFSGAGIELFLTLVVLSTLLLSLRAGVVALLVCLLSLAGIGVGFVHGAIPLAAGMPPTTGYMTSWATAWAVFVLLAGAMVLSTGMVQRHLIRSVATSQRQALDLQKTNRELAAEVEKHRATEKRAKLSEEQFKALFEMAPDPIYLNDAEGTFLDGNQAAEKLLGIERRKYVGRAFHEMGILPPEELPKAMELLEANRRGEPTGPDEINLITAKGQRVTVEIMTQPMKLGDRELILCMARDISVRKHLEARLAQAQRMDALGTLSSGIAHDFNNILAAILGYAELALDETPSDLPVRQNLEVIAKSAAKARNLVRQILTFSRNVEVQKRPLSIDRVAKEAAAILERTLPKMITLELDLQDDLRPVVADPQQMEQVFINLATNAADAMERGGTISISVRNTLANNACPECGAWLAGPHVELSVSDQGAGISPEVQKKIFEPFFTTKGVGKGTGLGLSTVYGIVSGHGGHICCRSQEGQGTEFAIYLPVAEEAAVNAGSVEQDDSKGLRGSGTILVVDDEDAVRDIAEKMLNRFGYQVLAAASGEQALETYRERRNEVDLVLMDLGMPGMGGKACLEEIRRLDPDAKVLIASGYIQYEATDEWESLGAAGMVPKPYGRADILKAIKEALGS